MTHSPAVSPGGLLARSSPLLAWVLYLPLGAKYMLALAGVLLAAQHLRRHDGLRQAARHPAGPPLLALLAWLSLSTLWSPAAGPSIAAHLWSYTMPLLLLPLLATAISPAWARRALQQFCVASGVVGGLFLLHHLGAPADSTLWSSTVSATGNQRIANSILLALGSALALWECVQARGRRGPQAIWLTLATLAAVGLALQDRRSGMLLLPLLVTVWLLRGPHSVPRRVGGLAVLALACALTLAVSDGVRQRFDEGLRELQADTSTDVVATSWGQRLRMIDVTVQMIAERPWVGRGVGSWVSQWQERTASGTALHEHTTPHNEYLLLAQQGGLPAVVLLLAAGLALWRAGRAAGPAGIPLLMVCTAIASTGLFNAVLRDAKFSLPLLLLLGLSLAFAREDSAPPQQGGGPALRPGRGSA